MASAGGAPRAGRAPAATHISCAVFVLCGVEGKVGPPIHPRIWIISRVRCDFLSSAARLPAADPYSVKINKTL